MSASPSATSNAPSTNPTVSPTTCVDLKESGEKFTYKRYTSAGIYRKDKTGKKCKHPAGENESTIKKNCKNEPQLIGEYCKVTYDNCDDDSAAPSISLIEPKYESTDNDNVKFNVNESNGKPKGCKWLRNNVDKIAECCEVDKGAYLNCKKPVIAVTKVYLCEGVLSF